MAEKTYKTKEQNTFRFKSFADRIGDIDLRRSALYHIGHQNEQLGDEDNETYFHQTLKKWVVLNLTEEFSQFSRKCMKIVTLPQLIHQKDVVIDLLLERLATASNLSQQPLLELLYVLARDLREEFYPYFQRVLDRLICLLNTQDAEQLEWTLICLAYLFKALKPYLKRNIGVVFHAILPLLDEQRYEQHVTNFAVECFSFIARDVRDYKKFLDFVLDTVVREQVQSVQGCGRLLFEIMRGVKGQLHSVAGDFLHFIFVTLVDEQRKNEQQMQLLSEIVNYAMEQLFRFVYTQNMCTFWQKLCDVADSDKSAARIIYLIEIFLRAVTYREGKHLTEMDVVVPTILKMLENCMHSRNTAAIHKLSLLISKILLADSTQVTQLDTSRLIKKMLTVEQRDLYDEFVLFVVTHAQFELLVLPAVIACYEEHYDLQSLELLSSIVLAKQPLAVNANGLTHWRKYVLHLKKAATISKIVEEFQSFRLIQSKTSTELERFLLLCIITPHIRALDVAVIETKFKAIMESALSELVATDKSSVNEQLQIFALLFETSLHLGYELDDDFLKKSIDTLSSHIDNLRGLSCLNQVLTEVNTTATITGEQREQLAEKLGIFLTSNQHDLRLTAAHCLQSLYETEALSTPYACIYVVETIQPDINNYREKLLHLQKLETASAFYKTFQRNQRYLLDVVRFLLGTLYQNFKLVWEPSLQLLEEYAKVIPIADFWPVYKAQLEATTAAIKLTYGEVDAVTDTAATPLQLWTSTALNLALPVTNSAMLTQQELLNYRNLLWQRLPKLGSLVELKNRELVTLFFDFIHDEYRANFEKREHSWDLLANSNEQEMHNIEADSELEVDDDDDEEEIRRPKKQKLQRKTKQTTLTKSLLQTLQIKMGIFSVQPNPKALYREPEIYSFYMELLTGSNTALQKLALDCVMTYKPKALLPHKEQLYALIDEQKFKDELIHFKLDTINEDQRPELMKIMLRLLYGKMITRGTQRGASMQLRKSLILRFLGQCSTTEILWFLHNAFGRYAIYTADTVEMQQIPALVRAHFKLSSVCSPRKLQSIVNLLELIRKEFGGLMSIEFHSYMLKLLIFVGSTCQTVLESIAKEEYQQRVHAKMPLVFRNVKNAALLSLVNFLGHIDNFDWQSEQMACITKVFVWPIISRLSSECIHTPTPLLKLLLQWGEQERYFEYLNQQQAGDQQKDRHVIFHYIIELLLNERAKPAVRGPIMALVERLLVSGTNEDGTSAQSGIALAIVKPFIPRILQRIKMNVVGGKQTGHAKRRRVTIDKRDLNILSLLTGHVEEATTCDNLLQLLLPVLIARLNSSASEQVVACQIITTLSNLIKRLDAPEIYLLKLAPLFECVQELTARKLLCQLIADIAKLRLKQTKCGSELPAELCTRLRDTARLVLMLNAYDKRWVEQPDYDKRLDAIKKVKMKLEAGTVDLDMGALIIYNCCHFIRYDKDMALRDNASEHLQLLLPKLTQHLAMKEESKQQLNYLVNDIFLDLARRFIRDTNHSVRNEGVRLLGAMARECPEVHAILRDLAPLADKHDEEVDFFENLTHLQSHRHGRALLKFCSHMETLTAPPNTRTLTEFVLPLATRYLLQEKYASKHTVVDAAIETVGVACQLLPWQQYHATLRYYLMKMRSSRDYQKQCVRIVVRILDAFHFELLQTDSSDLLQSQTVPTRKKDSEADNDEPEENTEQLDLEAALLEAAADAEEEYAAELHDATKQLSVTALKSILKASTPLTPNASKRVLSTIITVLIPTLNRAITAKSHYDTQHKLNRKRVGFEREEEEILRVPIALALVKLMQKLPKELLDTNLPGVFMKVCTFLRSPLKSVRMLTRDILKKIMLALGASYLALLVEHLQSLLTRGFQVHVLSVTIHGVLDGLRGKFEAGDIDSCLGNLLEVALNDIFGDIAAEKEVQKIATQTPEAKPSAKSYLILHIAARNIQEACLLDLLMPFKEHLIRSHARKLVLKIQECFAKIVSGLAENPLIPLESLLIFIYGTVSESITDLLPGVQKRVLSEQEKEKMRRARPDCYILQPTPQRRMGAANKNVKSNAQANAHILIEFGLELLYIILKRKKLAGMEYQPFINPLLPLLRDALKSTQIRVTTFTLKCLAAIWNNEYELPELDSHLNDIVKRMFSILQNLSTFGSSKQEDNIQLIKSTLKAMVALLRQCPQYTLTPEQIDQLVFHIEQDLYEGDKQLLSFALLKAMIARKVDTPAVHNILKQIAQLTITSQSDYVRDESRSILLTYVMEYTLNRRVDQILKNFSVQLCYTVPAGRLSAIQFLANVIKRFPQSILSKRAEFLFLSLGTRLVNDDDSSCRKAVADCLESLISRLEKTNRQRLFEITLLFFEEARKPSVREMAATLCSRFLNVEKRSFGERLREVLPLIVARLTLNDSKLPGKFVRAPNALSGAEIDAEIVKDKQMKLKKKGKLNDDTPTDDAVATAVTRKQRAIDHEIIQMQYCVHKMLEHCLADLFSNADKMLVNNIDELAFASQRLLAHEHAWVRCNAAKTISQILSHYDFTLVGKRLCDMTELQHCQETDDANKVAQWMHFIYANPASDIKSLILDLCAQMIPGETPQPMIDEIAKIFLYVSNMLRDVPFVEKAEETDDASQKINLKWLVGRMRYLINKEVAKAPHCVTVRTAFFTLIEGMITILKVNTVVELSPTLLLTLVREMSEDDQQLDLDLRQLALHVGSRLRKCIGSDLYDKLRTHAQTVLMMRRAERKKILAQEKIHDPVRAAKRKASIQVRKKAAKKRKSDVMRGKVEDVKQKLKRRKRKADSDDVF